MLLEVKGQALKSVLLDWHTLELKLLPLWHTSSFTILGQLCTILKI